VRQANVAGAIMRRQKTWNDVIPAKPRPKRQLDKPPLPKLSRAELNKMEHNHAGSLERENCRAFLMEVLAACTRYKIGAGYKMIWMPTGEELERVSKKHGMYRNLRSVAMRRVRFRCVFRGKKRVRVYSTDTRIAKRIDKEFPP
jgi:hypothetical protein